MSDDDNLSRRLKAFLGTVRAFLKRNLIVLRGELRFFAQRAIIAPREETANAQIHRIELGIGFCLELAIVLYQLGAEQMDLPHNFWVGLVCWVVGLGIAVRMFWILTVLDRICWPTKSVASVVIVSLFVRVMWAPVIRAYGQQYGVASEPDLRKMLARLSPHPPSETPREPTPSKQQHRSGEGFMSIEVAPADPNKVVDVGSPINFLVIATNVGREAVTALFMFSAFMPIGEINPAHHEIIPDAKVVAKEACPRERDRCAGAAAPRECWHSRYRCNTERCRFFLREADKILRPSMGRMEDDGWSH
jgi:hypothetical protein